MKKHLLLAFVVCITANTLGQISNLIEDFKLDFAVPDNPAFKILGKDPSNIIRPSNLEELTTTASYFRSGSSVVLPESFALELAPDLLLKRKMTLSNYSSKKNKFLRSIRISLGTSKASENNGETDLGIGLRFSLINDGDYKTEQKYQQKIARLLADDANKRQRLADNFRELYGYTAQQIAASAQLREREEAYIDTRIGDPNTELEAVNKQFEEDYWNAQKWDLAFATRGISPDSLVNNVELKAFAAWTTYANGIGSWGQYLIGINYRYDELTPEENNLLSFNTRLYAGKNRIKGFIEVQYETQDLMDTDAFLLNTGFEINVVGSLWANVSFGVESVDENNVDRSAFKSDFDIKYRF